MLAVSYFFPQTISDNSCSLQKNIAMVVGRGVGCLTSSSIMLARSMRLMMDDDANKVISDVFLRCSS